MATAEVARPEAGAARTDDLLDLLEETVKKNPENPAAGVSPDDWNDPEGQEGPVKEAEIVKEAEKKFPQEAGIIKAAEMNFEKGEFIQPDAEENNFPEPCEDSPEATVTRFFHSFEKSGITTCAGAKSAGLCASATIQDYCPVSCCKCTSCKLPENPSTHTQLLRAIREVEEGAALHHLPADPLANPPTTTTPAPLTPASEPTTSLSQQLKPRMSKQKHNHIPHNYRQKTRDLEDAVFDNEDSALLQTKTKWGGRRRRRRWHWHHRWHHHCNHPSCCCDSGCKGCGWCYHGCIRCCFRKGFGWLGEEAQLLQLQKASAEGKSDEEIAREFARSLTAEERDALVDKQANTTSLVQKLLEPDKDPSIQHKSKQTTLESLLQDNVMTHESEGGGAGWNSC